MYKTRVRVTGTGCVCSAGRDVPGSVRSLYSGQFAAPGPPNRFEPEFRQHFPVFEALGQLSGPKAGQADLFLSTRLVWQAAYEALQRAGLTPKGLQGAKVGVCIGTTVGASLNILGFYRDWRQGLDPDLRALKGYLRSNPAFFLQRELSLAGPWQTVTNACSSGTDALGVAKDWIEQGLCDLVLAGGTDELNELAYNGFIRLMNCSDRPCRPFDLERKGLNLGEGAAIVVLESEAAVQKRKVRVLGTIAGYGTAADAYHLTAPHPEARGLERAFDQALEQAGLAERDIGVVSVHGTGTKANDQAEAFFLRRRLAEVPFFGSKGMTGHTLGAAGAMEAVFTLACLGQGTLPATAGHATFDPGLGLAPAKAGTSCKSNWGLSQSLAFGGNSSALIIGGPE